MFLFWNWFASFSVFSCCDSLVLSTILKLLTLSLQKCLSDLINLLDFWVIKYEFIMVFLLIRTCLPGRQFLFSFAMIEGVTSAFSPISPFIPTVNSILSPYYQGSIWKPVFENLIISAIGKNHGLLHFSHKSNFQKGEKKN